MADNFKLGDTVMLKSGGPVMTITYVPKPGSPETMYHASWFDYSGKSGPTEGKGRFPAEALKHQDV